MKATTPTGALVTVYLSPKALARACAPSARQAQVITGLREHRWATKSQMAGELRVTDQRLLRILRAITQRGLMSRAEIDAALAATRTLPDGTMLSAHEWGWHKKQEAASKAADSAAPCNTAA